MATQASWVSKQPSEMTYDELAEASKTVRARLEELSPETNNLNSVNYALQYEVSQRFSQPGYGGNPGTYPADWVVQYPWPDTSQPAAQ